MQKKVFLIGKCVKKINNGPYFRFHYRGVFLGREVEGVDLLMPSWPEIGQEYLIYFNLEGFESKIILGTAITVREVDDL